MNLKQKKIKVKIISYLINSITIKDLLKNILSYVKKKKSHYICISNVHSCIESFLNKNFKKAHNSADLALPDGRPIYWALKLLGKNRSQHLPGYLVTEKICEISAKNKIKIGFYGSKKKILNNLEKKLVKKFKNLNIVFKYSPPFTKLSDFQDAEIVQKINKSNVKILFVCLGCPKQELWMYKHYNKINCTMIGIGAVVDFLSGNKKLPNKFFEFLGLAWLIRLINEPRRLFWRYFSTNILFLILFFLQISKIKKFD